MSLFAPSAFAEGETFFKASYEESRQAFLQEAETLKSRTPSAELKTFKIPSVLKDENLALDSLYVPPISGHKKRLLILTSGIHGIEGFVGSALQTQFLHEDFWQQKDPDLGVLILHSLNPYGFKYERRVSEHNVDLNRNFDTDKNLFQLKNEGYQKVRDLLNPTVAPQSGWWDRLCFYARAVVAIAQHSMESLRRAVLKGQYEFPEGIYFGGQDFEPQKEILEKEILNTGAGYEQILLVDLHTGYGERGRLHLFADRHPALDAAYIGKIFAGQNLDYGQKKDFYEVTGGLVVFAAKLFQQKAHYAGMVFEFGTLDSQKTLGSLDSIYRLVRENQLQQHGPALPADQEKIKQLFHEMFYPSDPAWRQGVQKQFRDTLSQALKNQRT